MAVTTGKKLGFKKGDFVHTGSFPGIIIAEVHTFAPMCEVWGFEHEMGSAYATDLRRLTFEEFIGQLARHGYSLSQAQPYSDVSKEAIAAGRSQLALASKLGVLS